jgi:hypothetical protein
MMSDYDKENWVQLFHTAMLELTKAKMTGRISEARASIVERMTKLQELPGLHRDETHAIQDAMNQLRVLEKEGLVGIAPRISG